MNIQKVDALAIGGGLASIRALDALDTCTYKCACLSNGLGASPFIHGIAIPVSNEDSVSHFIEDLLLSGYHQSHEELVNTLAEDSLGVFDYINSIGLSFNKKADGSYELLKPLGMSYPRVVSIENALGAIVFNKIKDEHLSNVDFINGRAIKIFHQNHSYMTVYVDCNNELQCILSKTILLAGGGFSKLYKFSTNSKDISGDTIAMAYDLGANLCDMEFVQFEPSVATYPNALVGKSVITTMFYEGAILTNKNGERFMFDYHPNGEKVSKDIMSKAIASELAKGNGCEHGGVNFDATSVKKDVLTSTYSSYYLRYKSVGIDISKTPMEIAPGAHTSLGGILIDKDCQTNVAGLFAAGECSGGIHGASRLGGCAGLEVLVFGKRAGNSLQKYLQNYAYQDDCSSLIKEAEDFIKNTQNNGNFDKINQELSEILQNCFGVMRVGKDMEVGLSRIEKLMEQVDEKSIAGIQTKNNLLVAYLLGQAAINRLESVGCHYRLDSQKEEQKYSILINKKGIEKQIL